MGVLYILDEPSIGLHQRDNDKLLATLKHLRDLGNTVIVVEHDEDTMRAADHIVDIGPGAGVHGGEVVYNGDVKGLLACEASITGQYLSGKRKVPVPETRRSGNGKKLRILGAAQNNLRSINVDIPLGKFVCVTGVSGSGKSSLINEILYKYLAAKLNGAKSRPGACKGIRGVEALDKVIEINQAPIGRTPRSNPATYTGVFGDIRELYASTQDAKLHGYGAGTVLVQRARRPLVRPARATVSSRSRCISCRMYMCRAMCARGGATTARRSRSNTRARAFTTCWR